MRSAPLWLLALVVLVSGCECGRGRLVAAQGGALQVTLVGADPEMVGLTVKVTDGVQARETSARISSLPLVTLIEELPPGLYAATVTAWDVTPAALRAAELKELQIVIGGVTEVTIDFSHGVVVTPSESCDGVDNDGDGEIDEALDLPVCVTCAAGHPTVVPDDERCGVIACDGLDTFELRTDTCVQLRHAPLISARCVGVGACAAPNGPFCADGVEQVVAHAEVCQVLEGCEEGHPSVSWAPDGTPCGASRVCQAHACVPLPVDAGQPGDPSGCSDGTREGFLSVSSYPAIAACAGGWSLPGVTQVVAPACGRVSGNSSGNREGAGCAASDLCAAGWHVCRGKDEVAQKANGSCADAVPPGAQNNSLFFAVSQASQSNTSCDTSGDNDVFGCGNLGTQLSPAKNCGVLTRALASTQPGTCGFNEAEPNLGPWQCLGGTQGDLHEGGLVTKQGCTNSSCSYSGQPVGNADKGGVLCCTD